MADIGNPVSEHGDAIDAETEGETGVFLRIPSRLAEHVGIHAPAAADFYPARLLAHAATRARFAGPHPAEIAGHIHFGRRLGEGEIAGPETHGAFGAEHVPGPQEKRPLEIG